MITTTIIFAVLCIYLLSLHAESAGQRSLAERRCQNLNSANSILKDENLRLINQRYVTAKQLTVATATLTDLRDQNLNDPLYNIWGRKRASTALEVIARITC